MGAEGTSGKKALRDGGGGGSNWTISTPSSCRAGGGHRGPAKNVCTTDREAGRPIVDGVSFPARVACSWRICATWELSEGLGDQSEEVGAA